MDYEDLYSYAYEQGYEDMLRHDVNWLRHKKDAGYADGVDDADYYLYKKWVA